MTNHGKKDRDGVISKEDGDRVHKALEDHLSCLIGLWMAGAYASCDKHAKFLFQSDKVKVAGFVNFSLDKLPDLIRRSAGSTKTLFYELYGADEASAIWEQYEKFVGAWLPD